MNFIEIVIYSTCSGKEPYVTWENKLDLKTRAIIKNRLDRIRLGNFGDTKRIRGGGGILELRIDFGPGYRIYFGKNGTSVIVLLAGGSKKGQDRDILRAKRYWIDCEGLK